MENVCACRLIDLFLVVWVSDSVVYFVTLSSWRYKMRYLFCFCCLWLTHFRFLMDSLTETNGHFYFFVCVYLACIGCVCVWMAVTKLYFRCVLVVYGFCLHVHANFEVWMVYYGWGFVLFLEYRDGAFKLWIIYHWTGIRLSF